MYRYLINTQKQKGLVESFALGAFSDPPKWEVPSNELIAKINIDGLRAVSNCTETDAVCFVGNINWPDWNTVVVNFGTSHNLHEAAGSDSVKLEYINGTWEMPEPSY